MCGEFSRAECGAQAVPSPSWERCRLPVGHQGPHVLEVEVTARVWSDADPQMKPEDADRVRWPRVDLHSQRCQCKGRGIYDSGRACHDYTIEAPSISMTLGQWLQAGRPSDTENACLALDWSVCRGCQEGRPTKELRANAEQTGVLECDECRYWVGDGKRPEKRGE